MSKKTNNYVCQSCGATFKKWAGKCEDCGQWGSVIEEVLSGGSQYTFAGEKSTGKKLEGVPLAGDIQEIARSGTGVAELDRVLGGGLVRGSAILIGGDPGIGKSTIVLQTVASLANSGKKPLYVSGEESVDQVRLRAKRLKLEQADVKLVSATNVKDIIASIEKKAGYDIVVIDSIQTMFVDTISSAPGTVSQVRASAHELVSFAKSNNITMLIVGHVTKEGQIAGPKVLEHMVDTVLYFEGERGHQFRILRAVKNRFGAANEIGVFEMCDVGLMEVPNPSALFLTERGGRISGATVFAGMEGTRPVLVEVQALVAPTSMPTPRRAVVGWDTNRLSMVVAILHARYGMFLADKEIYLNMAGGLKVNEPAADLAVACALISSVTNIPLPHKCVVFGELGLSGEVRMVSQSDVRLRETQKLGFEQAIVPQDVKKSDSSSGLKLYNLKHIKQLSEFFAKETA